MLNIYVLKYLIWLHSLNIYKAKIIKQIKLIIYLWFTFYFTLFWESQHKWKIITSFNLIHIF